VTVAGDAVAGDAVVFAEIRIVVLALLIQAVALRVLRATFAERTALLGLARARGARIERFEDILVGADLALSKATEKRTHAKKNKNSQTFVHETEQKHN
jgi:hypothetical protein